MATTQRLWENGDILTADYTGSGDGIATFSSVVNEGVDRAMEVTFEGDGATAKTRRVVQQGKRQPLILADGAELYFSDGKRAIVIKEDIEDE